MAQYYMLISHHTQDNGERDSFYLDTQLRSKHLSIGWGEVNPFGKQYEKIKKDIELHYETLRGTINPDNGGKSLPMFCQLKPGDVVFVRGAAKILDVVLISGNPFYLHGDGHDDNYDYCTKVPFVPLFENVRFGARTIDIPEDLYSQVLYDGGVKLVMRAIDEGVAMRLLKLIIEKSC